MEWLDAIKVAIPLFGPVGALLLCLLIWEKREHSKTRSDLARSQESRISEAVSLTAVVTGSNIASNARDASQREVTRALETLTAVVQAIVPHGRGRS